MALGVPPAFNQNLVKPLVIRQGAVLVDREEPARASGLIYRADELADRGLNLNRSANALCDRKLHRSATSTHRLVDWVWNAHDRDNHGPIGEVVVND